MFIAGLQPGDRALDINDDIKSGKERERKKKVALTKVKDVSGEQLLVRLRSVLKRRASGHRVHSRHRHAWLMVQELSSRPKVFF